MFLFVLDARFALWYIGSVMYRYGREKLARRFRKQKEFQGH